MLGLTAATFATTDSAITALTTSFCIDFLGFDKDKNTNSAANVRIRHWVHIGFSFLILVVRLLFNAINNTAVVSAIFKVATFTYGPLLGLFAFAIFVKKRQVWDKATPFICLLAPFVCYLLDTYSKTLLGGYVFAEELIIVNGLLTFVGLFLASKKTAVDS
jgi:hypothetical protein